MSQDGGFYDVRERVSASGGPLHSVRYPRGSERHEISLLLADRGMPVEEQGGHSSEPSINQVLGVQQLAALPGIGVESSVNSIAH